MLPLMVNKDEYIIPVDVAERAVHRDRPDLAGGK